MALTHPKCPSISFLKRLVQPASLRRWNSSFISGYPVSSLRDRKPTEERMPQPFSSFIFHMRKHGPLGFCFHRCSLDICSSCRRWDASVDVAVDCLSSVGLHYGEHPCASGLPLMSTLFCGSIQSPPVCPSSGFLLGLRTSLPCCHSASTHITTRWSIIKPLFTHTNLHNTLTSDRKASSTNVWILDAI